MLVLDCTEKLKDGDNVTVSCSEGETGIVYQGELKYEVTTQEDSDLPTPPVKL